LRQVDIRETQKSEATLSEVLRTKQAVNEMKRGVDTRLKAVETLTQQLERQFNEKQASFEEEFSGNFEMITNIVLHTDKETMTKIKDLEKRFTESHSSLVDLVK